MKSWRCRLVAALICASFPAVSAWADGAPMTPEEAAIAHTLSQRIPALKIESVKATALPDIYEVFLGDRLVYTDRQGDYVFMGDMIDARTRQNLSAVRMETLGRIDFDKLPFDRAIKIVKGDGRRRFAVFADPDCPYCQALERELRAVDNATMYVFLYPIESLHPGATAHAHQIWCSSQPAKAWGAWVLERTPPAAAATPCDSDPVAELHKLGDELHVIGTPTIFLSTGYRMPGVPRAFTLDMMLGPGTPASPQPTANATGPAAAAPAAPTPGHY